MGDAVFIYISLNDQIINVAQYPSLENAHRWVSQSKLLMT